MDTPDVIPARNICQEQDAPAKSGIIAARTHPIPPETIEAIRALSPIEDLVGEKVELRRSGVQFVGRCPFHDERSPSFSVSPEKGVFFCHGCRAGGDVFAFIQRVLGCGFRDAAAYLARRAGIALDGFKPSPELQERVANLKARRDEQLAFERFIGGRLEAVAAKYRAFGRAATRAEECLRAGILELDEQELAWDALARYRNFEAQVEREGLCDQRVLRGEWAAREGGRHTAA